MQTSRRGPLRGQATRISAVRRRDTALLAIAAFLGGSVATAQTTPGQISGHEIEFANEKVNALNLSVALGAIQSDNVSRVSTNEESGSVAISSLNLKYRENTRRILADVDADIGYEHFLDGEFEDGVIGQADGSVTVGLLPERIEWYAEDQFRQARVDPFGADTPENRQNVNRFATGPDVRLRLNDALAMQISSRYARVDYETAVADSDRVSGSIALVRQLATARAVSLNVSREAVTFDDVAANVSYDRDSAFVRYEASSSRTELTTDVGYMRIKDDLGKTANGVLLDVLLLRHVSADSRLALNLGTRFSDSGDIVRLTPGTDRGGLDPVVELTNARPFEGRFVNLGWEFGRNRTGLGAFVEYRQERYSGSPEFDRDLTIYGAHVNRRLSSRTEVYVRVDDSREEFANGGYNKELHGNLGVMVRVGNSGRIALEGQRIDRKSTNSVSEFTENRLSLFVVWTPVARTKQ
jgi:hypothetical protein